MRIALLAALFPLTALAQPADNIGHERHHHHHNHKHETRPPTSDRFITTRASDILLPLPDEQDAFTFIVFGDRTGGPRDGVAVLADAVRDTNLLEPDFVMTIGDLVQGYNATPQWIAQANEYKGIMNELLCPWFPVVGNHDIYYRGPDRPPRQHEADFEMHFGPLWYAFEHKNCWFIALDSDEGNPETGEFTFEKPDAQRMSPEQFDFLKTVLERANDADHVFLFLHHPRWLKGNYGDDWDRVHDLLLKAGNVTAVFAGHIHRMRYDPQDGIDYVALATVGGEQPGDVPEAGWLHQFHVITVRKNQVAMAAIPVGDVMDVREITGRLADQCRAQSRLLPIFNAPLTMRSDGHVSQDITASYTNSTEHAIDVTFIPDSADSRWLVSPDHHHARVEPGQFVQRTFAVRRAPNLADHYYRPLELTTAVDVLLPGHRYSLPTRSDPFPVDLSALPAPARPAADLAMHFDGDDALLIPNFTLPDGPMTIECWLNAEEFGERTGLICKTEQSDYGVFVNRGRVEFSIFLNSAYATVATDPGTLTPGRWHHVACVFDGSEMRIYVDGARRAAAPASGRRKVNRLPLIVGADVTGRGQPESFFKGRIDALRIASAALYDGDSFSPARRAADARAVELLTNFDAMLGLSVWGEGKLRLIGAAWGDPELTVGE